MLRTEVNVPHSDSGWVQTIKNPRDLSLTAVTDIGLAGVLNETLETLYQVCKASMPLSAKAWN